MDIKITPHALSGSLCGIASKSFAHRALICAALANSESKIRINSTSQDIEATVSCLKALGCKITESGGVYSVIPMEKKPVGTTVIDCAESGSTLRFLLPVICALGIEATVIGHGRLPERPLSPLKEELIRCGAQISDCFPLKVGGKLRCDEYSVAGNVSSQFITGLLLALALLGGESKINVIPPIESKPYIDMTVQVIKDFGTDVEAVGNSFILSGNGFRGSEFSVEADWSNAAFWLCSGVGVSGLNINSAQGDREIINVLEKMGAKITFENEIKADVSQLHGCEIDASQIPDAVPVIAATAATAKGKTVIYNAQRLRLKESDRIETTVKMLTSLGADVTAAGSGLIINGKSRLSGGKTDSFGDHRIAMAAAVAAAKCENEVIIENALAINKSYPEFFKDYNKCGGKADVL